MARGINKVILVGALGTDPETRYSGSGTAITSLSVATNEEWKDKQSGEKQSRTEWHRVKMFGKLAEIAGEYLKKGRQVYIEGSLRTDKYTDKNGVEKYSTDIIASDMQMLGGNEGGQRTERPRSPSRAPVKDCPQPEREASNGFPDGDDIPFRQFRHHAYY